MQTIASLILALAGSNAEAQNGVDKLGNDSPMSTTLQFYWLPTIRVEMELIRGNAADAIRLVRTTIPFELGVSRPVGALYSVYVRGQAYLAMGKGTAAAAEFQKILDRTGLLANFHLDALAHVGVVRAYMLKGDRVRAKTAYQDFLTLWKDADPDIPNLMQAKAESAKLQ